VLNTLRVTLGIRPEDRSQSARVIGQPVPNCTSCGRNDVRRSHSRGLFDGIARTLGFKPYRCRACRARFFAK
jgi:hypothetical protein